MKNLLSILLISLIIICNSFGQNEYYIKFKDEMNLPKKNASLLKVADFPIFTTSAIQKSIVQINNSFGDTKSEKLRKTFRIKFTDEFDVEKFLTLNKHNKDIEYIEEVVYCKTTAIPDDYGYDTQWYLDKIHANAAFEITNNSSNVKVAIVDDAVLTTHPDLQENIIAQRDVTNNTNNANPPSDLFDHGTHVAGIACASTNNNLGIAAIGDNAKIIAVKVANGDTFSDGSLKLTHSYEGIVWAVDNGADIINCSWGGGSFGLTQQAILDYAESNEVIVIAAAGNDDTDEKHYPAAYSTVVAVAATDFGDQKATFSNFGSWVDISAPGVSIYSTVIFDSEYAYSSGTSMASPLVAGLCALIKSKNPNFSSSQIKNHLFSTAENIEGLNPDYQNQLGAGRINAGIAISGSIVPDDCSKAIKISMGEVNIFSNSGASASFTLPNISCLGGQTEDIWFKLNVEDIESDIYIESIPLPNGLENTVLQVLEGSCTSLTEIGCDDDSGDGLHALVTTTTIQPNTENIFIRIVSKNPNEFGRFRLFASTVECENYRELKNFGESSGWRETRHPRWIADVNGDGKDDIIGAGYNGLSVAISSGQEFVLQPDSFFENLGYNQGWRLDKHPRMVGDVNGDGRFDIIGFGQNAIAVALSEGNSFSDDTDFWFEMEHFCHNQGWRVEKHPRLIADINGDGKDDIIGFSQNGTSVATSNGTSFVLQGDYFYPAFGYNQGWRVDKHPRMVGDVNGDGKEDIIGFGYDGVTVALSNGKGFDNAPDFAIEDYGFNQGWRIDKHPRMVADVNGDGLTDIIGFGYNKITVAISTGEEFIIDPNYEIADDFVYNTGWRVDKHPRMAGDINGDGKDDMIAFGTSKIYIRDFNQNRTENLLEIDRCFSFRHDWSTVNDVRSLGDFQGDGAKDVIAMGNRGVYLYEFDNLFNVPENSTKFCNYHVYPNPAIDYLKVNIAACGENARLILYDQLGRIVLDKEQSEVLDELEMNSIPNGVYFLEIIGLDGKILGVERIMKI
ncbi:MAG: hypothetical protein DHS20C13_29060 [Thermodesulfobacteriota bacterium]|nr:MAG: hypothetical protein DHS20C13_29060 [Thermodesulfobacteriota bacterium]GJM36618.1 MAG: hypothetical protein DHS20C18_56190 [Saprospiraceae bacterium]